ncbi:MAG: hypothetical protein M0014_10830 [Actinomycetota bacterium]|nr:hypothetical protein [Actinomycetota bacterium]
MAQRAATERGSKQGLYGSTADVTSLVDRSEFWPLPAGLASEPGVAACGFVDLLEGGWSTGFAAVPQY